MVLTMKHLILLAAVAASVVGDDLPPTCDKPVFCNSDLLHHAQMAHLYPDSKTFVDLQMRNDENTTVTAFQALMTRTNGNPSKEHMKTFVDEYFVDNSGLDSWTPTDYEENPEFLNSISDETLKKFAKDINDIWLILGRKIQQQVYEIPDQFSLVPVTHPFIVPGGRFKEMYYWDSYWVIEGLIISDMTETAKGMIENFIELLNTIGLIPNGSRWYYQRRSHPPLLSSMMFLYYQKTKDIKFLRDNIDSLEKEMDYWMDSQLVTFSKDDRIFTLLRYYTPSFGPRPESYYEDYNSARIFSDEDRRNEFYTDMKSAAESGWDFSSRWFMDAEGKLTHNLTDIHTQQVIPVDLNSIFANALENTAYFHSELKNPRRAAHWGYLSEQWKRTIQDVFWNEEDGIWYDYDMLNQRHRKYFYPFNLAPLWKNAVDPVFARKHASQIMSYVRNSHSLDYPGGIPVSLNRSGEQWDFPNVWPPEVSIFINGLENLGTDDSRKLAFEVAQHWVRVCHKGFGQYKQLFEKYDAETPGEYGGGGEYNVQIGFGWTNGGILELLNKYGESMTAYDSLDVESEKKSEKDDNDKTAD